MKVQHLLTTQEWPRPALEAVLERAHGLKRRMAAGERISSLERKTLVLLLGATSTRTRSAFETAMVRLGGHALYTPLSSTRHDDGETLGDLAAVYSRHADGIAMRIGSSQGDADYLGTSERLRELAAGASIPVINLADGMFHPSQGLTDLMTVQERFPRPARKRFVVMWANGRVPRTYSPVHSAVLVMTRFGLDVTVCRPEGFDLHPRVMAWAEQNAKDSGGSLAVSEDPREALTGAHVVFARNWHRAAEGAPEPDLPRPGWTLDGPLAGRLDPEGIVLHVMPVAREVEITSEVVDGPRSRIFDQAENKLYVAAALLERLLGKGRKPL